MIGWFNNLEIMEFVGQFLETIELLGTAEFGSSVTPQCFSLFIKCFLMSFFSRNRQGKIWSHQSAAFEEF